LDDKVDQDTQADYCKEECETADEHENVIKDVVAFGFHLAI
jgi:hypothetical protein